MDITVACQICESDIDPKSLHIHREAEAWVLDRIKEANPEWVEENGSCPRCVEYYRTL